MTALAALVQSVECPWACRFDGAEVRSSLMDVYSEFQSEVLEANPVDTEGWNLLDYRNYGNAKFDAWRNRITTNVQTQQQIEGIPIKTIQQAIDDGDYLPLIS